MYSTRSGLILGFHGCDESVLFDVLNGKAELRPSENNYDWLGSGTYFWEGNYDRALAFARHLKKHPSRSEGKTPIKTPAVLGAVISLGCCLDLLESDSLRKVEEAYLTLKELEKDSEWTLPENVGGSDLLLRRLDCAVIQNLHQSLDEGSDLYYDSVRGMFSEGKLLYPNAGFHKKNHIQLCIRNPNCIKGYFLPRKLTKTLKKI
ncbi:MAG: hypothetical protein K8S62_15455 [Candidatus Sabulitectum sp.]|nr:hypothetical protein [Candidatus Sabulitectum sp.]